MLNGVNRIGTHGITHDDLWDRRTANRPPVGAMNLAVGQDLLRDRQLRGIISASFSRGGFTAANSQSSNW